MGGADRLELRGALRARLGSHAGRRAAARGRPRPCRPRMGERTPRPCAQRRVYKAARRLSGQHRDDAGDRTAMRTVALPLVVLALLLAAIVPIHADEFKPAYLQLTQLDQDTYDVLWKIPAIDEATTLKVKPQFPEGTEALTTVRRSFSRGVTVQRWRIRVPHGLDGQAVIFSQLSETRIDVLARLVRLNGSVQLERILPVSPRFVAAPSPGALEVVKTYTVLGIEHILTGFDHLLYILGMLILVGGWRRIVVTMSA